MTFRNAHHSILPYTALTFTLFILSIISLVTSHFFKHDQIEIDIQLLVLGGVLGIGYWLNRLAPKTIVPSFVWAIFAGIALQPILHPFLTNVSALKVTMEVAAAFVLFAGGIEIPFKMFRRWFGPISSLAVFGLLLSSIVFSFVLWMLTTALGIFQPALIPSIIIISASLASADPTAIIPALKELHFKRKFLKDIAVAETALTDVTGTVLTKFLLLAIVSVGITQEKSVIVYIAPLLQKATYDAFALQIISGIFVGFIGYWLIKRFYVQPSDDESHRSDPALLLSVPLFTFVLGNVLGGAGLLASFVSGLLSEVAGGLKRVSHFYDSVLNHLMKPFIFIVLGAIIPLPTLIKIAPLGIAAGVLFMFVVRPLVVYVSLFPWLLNKQFKFRDLVFLSLIRETGIIAAILLIIAASYEVIASDFTLAVGMWVILLTLIIEPPITPFIAKKIGVAT